MRNPPARRRSSERRYVSPTINFPDECLTAMDPSCPSFAVPYLYRRDQRLVTRRSRLRSSRNPSITSESGDGNSTRRSHTGILTKFNTSLAASVLRVFHFYRSPVLRGTRKSFKARREVPVPRLLTLPSSSGCAKAI